MALSSLFVLTTEHGLEYPNFYEKLYASLEPSIFIAKHRAKVFQLLDSCIESSPLLPAYLAASFAKKLSRLALFIPPLRDLVTIALIHNLLRRHPSINYLVHWEDSDGTTKDSVLRSARRWTDLLAPRGPQRPSRRPFIKSVYLPIPCRRPSRPFFRTLTKDVSKAENNIDTSSNKSGIDQLTMRKLI